MGVDLSSLITLGTTAVGALAGSKGVKSPAPNYVGVNPKIYEFSPDERADVRSGMMGVLGDVYQNNPGGAAFWGGATGAPGGDTGSSSYGYTPASYGASQADLSQVPEGWSYNQTAPKEWMSGMLSQGKELLGSQANDQVRQMRDQAIRSGMSTSSPAYAYMANLYQRKSQQALADKLREAGLSWLLPAAERNARRQELNMTEANRMSQFNANLRQQADAAAASAANEAAQRNLATGQWAAQFARSGYEDLWSMMKDVVTMGNNQQFLNMGSTSGGGLGGALAGAGLGYQYGSSFADMTKGQTQANSGNSYYDNMPMADPQQTWTSPDNTMNINY
jgi:hypothetical protein